MEEKPSQARAERWLFAAIALVVGFSAGVGVWSRSGASPTLAILLGSGTGIVVTIVAYAALRWAKTL